MGIGSGMAISSVERWYRLNFYSSEDAIMNKNEVIRETLNRLFLIRQGTTHKTKEEIWLESILRILLDIPADKEILVDLNTLKSEDFSNL